MSLICVQIRSLGVVDETPTTKLRKRAIGTMAPTPPWTAKGNVIYLLQLRVLQFNEIQHLKPRRHLLVQTILVEMQ